nr:hypothetical protein [Tanacetum cinerariifolium]
VECYNCHKKGHFARECRSPKDTRRPAVAEHKEEVYPLRLQLPMLWSLSVMLQTGLESVEARLLVYKKNESVLEENIKLLNIEVQLRDTALATLRQKLEITKKDRDDLNIKLEKFQTSSKRLTDLLASQTSDKAGLGGGYHAVPPPMTGTFMPPKPDLVFHTPLSDENEHLAFNVQLSPTKPEQDLPTTSSAPIIEDWVSDSEEADLPQVTNDVPSLAQSPELVKNPRHSGLISPPPIKLAQNSYETREIHKHNAPMKYSRIPLHKVTTAARTIGAARLTFSKTRPHIVLYTVSKSKASIKRPFIRHTSPKPSISPPRVNAANPFAVSAARVNAVRPSAVSAARINAVKPSAVTAELNGGYVTFGGNPKGGNITGKGKIKTGKLDFDDVYYV